MISKNRKYFSLFGILAATVDKKIQSINCMIHSILSKMPKITKQLLQKQLKPIKLYSTNNI
ncbi:MAG: hypothetical protein AB7S49_08000 [Arcobacter sp.]|jgi:hypothetical protein|uniref:Uncharacterized protein n=1 Tax=Arcobacter defluvii TaxID=873191 RepID=A0AAE7BGG6_9BACT|nr:MULTISPECIES: hypothetical protein [Arcobacter]QKF77532.1 hypothetical protein ADFLV_1508 [Arcobacter defluvii]RXI31686.1 hypothetical protein CP964_09520 [Arcobacter defluvii]BAK73339.1 conserved hypothetical protein [Arcobacter sp. L]